MSEIKGKSVLILGYGREGQSVHRYLVEHFPTLKIGIADKNAAKPVISGDIMVYAGAQYLASLGQYDTVVRSPGVSPYLPELTAYQKKGGWITSATNLFLAACPGITIGVTGTKGKSTTASLIAHILKAPETYRRAVSLRDVRLCGNIGKPALDYLEGATKETIFVLELSSHQLVDVRYSPQVAVLLDIAPEHLDYYPSFKDYTQAKGNIVRFQKKDDVVIFNPTGELVAQLASQSPGQKISFVSENQFKLEDIPLLGNRENLRAAVTVAQFFKIPQAKIREALKTFKPLPHRLEFVGEFVGIKFYNDSLATIPEATIHALEALGSKVETLIAGGYDRGLDYAKLGQYLAQHPVKTLILFPDTGDRIWKAVLNASSHHPSLITHHLVKTMKEAVKLAYQHTRPGKICLLSPASASYNLFKNYEDRGEQFMDWVRRRGK